MGQFLYAAHRFEFFQQLFCRIFSNAFYLLQLIFESALAAFLAVKCNAEAVHLIAYRTYQFQAVAVLGQLHRLLIAGEKDLLLIFCKAHNGHLTL